MECKYRQCFSLNALLDNAGDQQGAEDFNGLITIDSNFLHYSIPNFSQNLFIMLNFIFCAAFSISIPCSQFTLPIKVSYLTLVELLKKYSFCFDSLMLLLSVLNPEWIIYLLSSSQYTSFTFST